MVSRRLLFASALFLAAPVALADPSAADKETARTLMDQGRDLRDAHDLKGALQRFSAADDIMQVPSTAWEVATTQAALGMLVEASDTAARIVNMPQKPREPVQFAEARQKAQDLIDSMQARIPNVTIVPVGLKPGMTPEVTIDAAAVPPDGVGLPRSVNPGHHVVAVQATGAGAKASGSAELDVSEGEHKKLEVPMTVIVLPTTHADTTETPPEPEQPHGHAGRVAAFVSFGVGGAALIAGSTMGALALSTSSDLSTKCPNHLCTPAQAGELSDGNTFALVSTIMLGVAGAAAVVGIVALVVSGHKPSAAASTAHVVPVIGPGSGGLAITF